jgi:hypothetical protein
MARKLETAPIEIIRPQISFIQVPVIGDSILVSHNWSEKGKKGLREAGTKVVKRKKDPRDPEGEFEGSLYRSIEGWCGIPAIGFKTSGVEACRYIDGLTMVEARGTLFVQPDGLSADGIGLVRIHGDGPHIREDVVRVGMNKADLRYRGYWLRWAALVTVRFNENVISQSQIANLLAIAGLHCGVGDGRPTSPTGTMDWGLWHLAEKNEYDNFLKALKAEPRKAEVRETVPA